MYYRQKDNEEGKTTNKVNLKFKNWAKWLLSVTFVVIVGILITVIYLAARVDIVADDIPIVETCHKCNDGNECTLDLCINGGEGCQFVPKNNNEDCTSICYSDTLDSNGTCYFGECIGAYCLGDCVDDADCVDLEVANDFPYPLTGLCTGGACVYSIQYSADTDVFYCTEGVVTNDACQNLLATNETYLSCLDSAAQCVYDSTLDQNVLTCSYMFGCSTISLDLS
jgi:hypothetical protein